MISAVLGASFHLTLSIDPPLQRVNKTRTNNFRHTQNVADRNYVSTGTRQG